MLRSNLLPASAIRSVRGHLSRARHIAMNPAPTAADHAAMLHHIRGAETALSALSFKEKAKPSAEKPASPARLDRDATHFQANGRFLSDAGLGFLHGLFEQGHSIRRAAVIIGISHWSAADHYKRWQAAALQREGTGSTGVRS